MTNTLQVNSSIITANITDNFSQSYINMTTGCTHFSIPVKSPASNYTSQGKRKCSRCDSITNPEDIERIKNFYLTTGWKCNRKRNYMIFVLGTTIGLRGCDLLRLQIGDVLDRNGTVKDRISTFESKTGKTNYPFINPTAKEAITNYLNSLPSIDLSDYLIKNMNSPEKKPMDTDTLYKIILNAKEKLNLPYHLGAHSLRKTFAYWTIKLHPENTDVMITLQEMLNHSSLRTTLRYAGICDNDYRKMYNDIGDFINNPKETNTPDIDNIDNIVDNLIPDDE